MGDNSANSRLTQISSHLDDQSWKDAIEELKTRQNLARQPDPKGAGLVRQRAAGKLWVRERIEKLVDKNSFQENGSITGSVSYDPNNPRKITEYIPTNNIHGTAKINGRPVIVMGDDFTVRGGHADGSLATKNNSAELRALNSRIPMVRLLDGSSGGGSVATYLDIGRTYVPQLIGYRTLVEQLSVIPVCCALLGPVVGLGAMKSATSHFNVMVADLSQSFAAGPPVVSYATFENVTKNQLGGVEIHARNGSVDNIATSEEDAFAQIIQFLSYMPSNVTEMPPQVKCNDPVDRREEELLSIIPKRRTRPFEIRRVIELIVDKDTFFEIGRSWGQAIVTGLARLDGKVVGVISQDCKFNGGTFGRKEGEKTRRFIDVMDTFGIPVLNLVDQPGIAVGTQAESEAAIRAATAAAVGIFQATIPIYTVILRRVFGVAGGAFMVAESGNSRVAWPSGDWGSLPLEGGVEAAFKGQLQAAKDEKEREKIKEELLGKFDAVRSPFRTAETFGVEEIIDPRDTRPLACEWVNHVYKSLLPRMIVQKIQAENFKISKPKFNPL